MRRIAIWLTAAVVVIALVAGSVGFVLFNRSQQDELTHADAIVVLGGDQDGRIDYGLQLARDGYADTVVLANSYEADNPEMIREKCASGTATITVICFIPDPWSTRGEARFTANLARERGWQHLIVVTWNYHLVRARYIFGRCFGGDVTMRAVPRVYDYSPLDWAWVYSYQYAAMVKAVMLGC